MGLPQFGSFLMLTENLCSNTFYKIPICSGTIEEQFALITRYCEDEFNGVDHTPADFKKLLSALNAGEFSIMNSLLDVLIDFTGYVVGTIFIFVFYYFIKLIKYFKERRKKNDEKQTDVSC